MFFRDVGILPTDCTALYPDDRTLKGNSQKYALDMRLRGPQSRPGSCGENTDFLTIPRIKLQFLCSPTQSLVYISTELLRFAIKLIVKLDTTKVLKCF
jgi:hypothetical protein